MWARCNAGSDRLGIRGFGALQQWAAFCLLGGESSVGCMLIYPKACKTRKQQDKTRIERMNSDEGEQPAVDTTMHCCNIPSS